MTELTDVIEIYRRLSDPQKIDQTIRGILPANLDFGRAEETLERHGLLIRASRDDAYLEFNAPTGFFTDLQSFLDVGSNRAKVPSELYLDDIDFLYTGDRNECPEDVRRYFRAVALYQAFSDLSDYRDRSSGVERLIFLSECRIEVSCEYTINELINLERVEFFKAEFMDSDLHRHQRRAIVKSVLAAHFGKASSIKFGLIISNFEKILRDCLANYELYVAEFSFEKIRSQIEAEKLKASADLNRIFSDIQNQLLAIPVAIVFAGSQLSSSGSVVSNLAVWSGVLVFSVLMNLLIRNQVDALRAISENFNYQWSLLRSEYRAIADRVEGVYAEVAQREKRQCHLLFVVELLVAGALVLLTVLTLSYSGGNYPLVDWTTYLYTCLVASAVHVVCSCLFARRGGKSEGK